MLVDEARLEVQMSMAAVLLVLLVVVPQAPQPQASRPVTYDEFFGLATSAERIRVFNEIDPENRATLVQTHVARWLGRNRSRLSTEQVAFLERTLRVLSADLYRTPRDPAAAATAAELDATARRLFGPEDAAQALRISGDYIAEESSTEQ